MDEEKSETLFQETAPSTGSDQTDSSTKLYDDRFTGDANSSSHKKLEITEEVVPIEGKGEQGDTAQMKLVPVLLNNNDQKEEYNFMLQEISINQPTVKTSLSSTNLLGAEFSKCHSLSSDSSLLQELCPEQLSTSSNAIHSVQALGTDFQDTVKPITTQEFANIELASDNKEEKHINNNLDSTMEQNQLLQPTNSMDKYENYKVSNVLDVIPNETQAAEWNNKTVEDTGQVQLREDVIKCNEVVSNNEEEKLGIPATRNTRLYTPIISRSTLVEDSKLVKISLPTNSINLMQSNAQFLNKSRNFLNFITEKSTNIMEKALLPQHLTVKYNSMMKSIDGTYGEKKCTQKPCTSIESSLTNSETNSPNPELNSTTIAKDIPDLSTGLINIQTDQRNLQEGQTVEHQNRNTFLTNTNEQNACTDTQSNKKQLLLTDATVSNDDSSGNTHNDTLEQIKQMGEPDCSNSSSLDKIIDTINFVETNGDIDVHTNGTILNPENDNSNLLPNRSMQTELNRNEQKSTDSEGVKQSLLQHPAYLTLLKDYADLKASSLKLQEKVVYLEERNASLEVEKNGNIFATQIETLEKTVDKLTSDLRISLATQEVLKKEYNAANKERESMVMKYAVSEKQLFDTQRARESAERKVKEMLKEQELLQNKLRQAQGERTRICTILDGKCRDVTDLQKEVERLKEDVSMKEVKLKWAQNKLKSEMDLQKETQLKLDKTTIRINEMKEECDQIRKETQESMRKFQQSEENKAVTLDQQLKEQQARLILERHVTEDKEMLRLQLQKEVEVLKHRQQALIEENNTLSLKVQDAEKNRLNYESNFNNLKVIADQRQKEIVDLLGKVSELETLKLQLQHKDQCLISTEAEIKILRTANEELQADMSACRQRETDMLNFTQKLTDKNVRLQSEFTTLEAKTKQLETEHGPLHERIHGLMSKIKSLEESLAHEQKTRVEECEILAKHLAEQTQLAQNLMQKLEDSQGENAVLRRKQQINMKEMTRELQQCRKRLEAFETSSPCNSLDVTSRTGSNISLNTGDTLNGALSDNSTNGDPPIQTAEPSRQALIDRIIKLQKINVRSAEKLDFLEEHTRTLVEELQKKSRIIQNYIFHENFDAMGSNERDRHKAELARHGGIMASVYSQRVSDDNMTLELSLEINQKLQAVLEDALLKNITLKDNIDTLGEEIARLTMQNQQRQVTN